MLSFMVQSQTQIEIINADKISFNKKNNKDRQVLTGNVKTKHNEHFMSCDSAYYYANENKIEAFSNIHIWQGDTLSLEGDYLIYLGNHQLAEIEKNVHFKHKEMNLTSVQLRYNFEHNKGFFDQKAIINEKNKSLKSNQGIYYASIEKFDFYNDVIIETEKETLGADTLYYWLENEYALFQSNGSIENNKINVKAQSGWVNQKEGKAFINNNVQITDLENNSILRSDTCYLLNEMNHSVSYGNTLLSIPMNEDTLYLTADTLFQQKKLEGNLLKAYPRANFKSINMVGFCDSLSYSTKKENLFLNKEPVIWLDKFQLTSDSIRILLNKDLIKMAFLNKSAFIASEVDSNSYNQISGENMEAYFHENKLSNIEVIGNGESIYYVEEEKKSETVGVNKIICSNMNITIKNRQIENINFYKEPDAMLYPLNQINRNDLLLKGLTWRNKSNVVNIIQNKMDKYELF
ncbi:MAG: OstA-like protein [Flavobacteriales bacterium]